jgi:hypothetical protein
VKGRLAAFKMAITMFRIDKGHYPWSLGELAPYLDASLIDPFGNPYVYVTTGPPLCPTGYELRSAGRDGELGTEDDVFVQEVE